ncbi:rod shape-determining protein MreD [Thalassovita taeanensis]|uniref:Rod shape-determining protein MreD n=1 Tax=Thalassovita taeanensis TaxID=657014 RepID=A0A1H9DE52_9RHOB|nr:rod shape-determining protein MreD [Thalassovita taeanensis]SEQ11008.1 rod shape-determining protein MreD [Thalassovita taeanensis]
MAEQSPGRVWTMRATYVALALVVIFFQLLPLETTPRRWAGPDLLTILGFAWALRRPDYVPVLAVAGVMLLADLLFQRPPGLMAALVVMATETLKARARGMRDQPFPVEWLSVSVMLVMVMLGNRMILALLLVPQAPVGLTVIQLVMTVLTYPVVVLASGTLLGVQKAAPGEVDALGHRL